jgi:periplasmic copper chaperone A
MKQSVLILFMFYLSLLTANYVRASEIFVTYPWIREAPAVAEVLAAFMTITNKSIHAVQLNSVSSDDFARIEIHRTEMHEGMAHMVMQSNLQIDGGANVVLQPGGYHLMLIKPKRSLQVSDQVKLQLHFDGGESIDVVAVVRKQ